MCVASLNQHQLHKVKPPLKEHFQKASLKDPVLKFYTDVMNTFVCIFCAGHAQGFKMHSALNNAAFLVGFRVKPRFLSAPTEMPFCC